MVNSISLTSVQTADLSSAIRTDSSVSEGQSYRDVMEQASVRSKAKAEPMDSAQTEKAEPKEAKSASEKPEGESDDAAEATAYANANLLLFQMLVNPLAEQPSGFGLTGQPEAAFTAVEGLLEAGAAGDAQLVLGPDFIAGTDAAELLGAQADGALEAELFGPGVSELLPEGVMPESLERPMDTLPMQGKALGAEQLPREADGVKAEGAQQAVLTEPAAEPTVVKASSKEEKASAKSGEDAFAGQQLLSGMQDVSTKDVQAAKPAETAQPKAEVFTARESSEAEEIMEQLPEDLANRLLAEQKEVTVQLEPENLGKLIIKASYEDGRAMVSILCTNERTLALLSSRAGEIGSILESNMGSPTEVVLNKAENSYLDQQQRQEDSQAGEEAREEQRQRQQDEHNRRYGSPDFLAQLRLGLA